MGYPDLKLGITLTKFTEIVQFPVPCMSIGYNQSFRLGAEFASKFLNFPCISYYSFNTKDLLALVSWEIYYDSPNPDSANNNLTDEISKVLGKANVDTIYNDPLEVRETDWAQDGLTLSLYYNKQKKQSFINLASLNIRSNDFGEISSITSFFKQKRISYKYEKEHQGKTLFGGRIVASRILEYAKKVNTLFVFTPSKNSISDKLKIGNYVFEISSIDTYSFEATDNKGNSCTIYFASGDPRAISSEDRQNQILIDYGENKRFRYYFRNP